MFGSLEGKRHDCTLLRESNVMPKLIQYAYDANGTALCLYGDPAYPLSVHLHSPFQHRPVNPQKQAFDTSMSKVRIAVELLFGNICYWFAFVDLKKKLKCLSAVGKIYLKCAFLTNARTCLYGNTTCAYFDIMPPQKEFFSAGSAARYTRDILGLNFSSHPKHLIYSISLYFKNN